MLEGKRLHEQSIRDLNPMHVNGSARYGSFKDTHVSKGRKVWGDGLESSLESVACSPFQYLSRLDQPSAHSRSLYGVAAEKLTPGEWTSWKYKPADSRWHGVRCFLKCIKI
jgi:hypothetical protein